MSREEIIAQLKKGDVVIRYHKLGGEYRDIKATLRKEAFPVKYQKDGAVSAISSDHVTVWDLEREAFRTLLIDQIESIREN